MTSNGDATLRVSRFLSQAFDNREFRADEDIFALGFGNSLFAMELVNFVESEFSIAVETEDLEMDNFQSIAAIVAFIERKRSRPGALGADHG